jgi:hypothetical protein
MGGLSNYDGIVLLPADVHLAQRAELRTALLRILAFSVLTVGFVMALRWIGLDLPQGF